MEYLVVILMAATVLLLWEITREIQKSRKEIASVHHVLRTALYPGPALEIDDTYPKRALIRLQEIRDAIGMLK
jgi:hypothetical protein